MKALILVKWSLICTGVAFAVVAAAPFFALAYWVNAVQTQFFVKDTGLALARAMASDVSRYE